MPSNTLKPKCSPAFTTGTLACAASFSSSSTQTYFAGFAIGPHETARSPGCPLPERQLLKINVCRRRRASDSCSLLHGTAFIIPTPMETGLKNRVAIVAASSQVIGRATAEAFAAEGCRVAMCARNPQTLQQAAAAIRQKYNAEVFSEALDVTDAQAVHQFVEGVVAKFGSADICVTNAGGPPAKGFLAASIEEWQKAVEQNFLSTVYFAREVIPHMQRKQWGRIITITSITTKQPVANLVWS